MFRKIIGSIILAFFCFGAAGCVSVHHHHRKPPPRKEVRPPKPGKHYVWIKGHWVRKHKRWIWIKGHWRRK